MKLHLPGSLYWVVLFWVGTLSLRKPWTISIGVSNAAPSSLLSDQDSLCRLVGLLVEFKAGVICPGSQDGGQAGWVVSPGPVMGPPGVGLIPSTVVQMRCRCPCSGHGICCRCAGSWNKRLLWLSLCHTVGERLWGGELCVCGQVRGFYSSWTPGVCQLFNCFYLLTARCAWCLFKLMIKNP